MAKQEEQGDGNDELGLMKYLCSYFKGIFNNVNFMTRGRWLYFPSKELSWWCSG
jgi:hypothetical protein